jgi:hypothetical protein
MAQEELPKPVHRAHSFVGKIESGKRQLVPGKTIATRFIPSEEVHRLYPAHRTVLHREGETGSGVGEA